MEKKKLLYVTRGGESEVKVSDFIPRIGDTIDKFYGRSPVVELVLLYPTEETLKEMKLDLDFFAIITMG
jgi:hypothetical protein